MKSRTFPPIPDYIEDAFIYLDAEHGATLLGRSGSTWLFRVVEDRWEIQRQAKPEELELVERAAAALWAAGIRSTTTFGLLVPEKPNGNFYRGRQWKAAV
jgi:hypothetical protein